MRVATRTTFENSRFHLGNLVRGQNDLNNQLGTGKKINELSDEPVGFNQVLNLRVERSNISQLNENMDNGIFWLEAAENSLTSIKDLINNTRTLCSKMVNDTLTATERNDIIKEVDNIFESIVQFANVQVKGSYVFSGDKTDTKAFEIDNKANPSKVTYNGNDNPFEIKFYQELTMEVGFNGKSLFTNDTIKVDSSNNEITFKETKGDGLNSTKVITAKIPDGKYTKSELATQIQKSMISASKESGYSINYTASYDSTTGKMQIHDDGKDHDLKEFNLAFASGIEPRIADFAIDGFEEDKMNINVLNKNAFAYNSKDDANTKPIELYYKDGQWNIQNVADYDIAPDNIVVEGSKIKIDFDADGSVYDLEIDTGKTSFEENDYISFHTYAQQENNSICYDIGFDKTDVKRTQMTSDNTPTLNSSGQITITNNSNDKIDFVEINSKGETKTLTADIDAGNYTPEELALQIETKMEAQSKSSGNNINYHVEYDNSTKKFIIEEKGSTLKEFKLAFGTGANRSIDLGGSGQSVAKTIGFSGTDKSEAKCESQNSISWGLMENFLDLRKFMLNNDTDGIGRTMTRLDSSFEKLNTTVSEIGAKYSKLEMQKSLNLNLNLNIQEREVQIEEIDLSEAILQLYEIDQTYKAALNSASTVMKLSLVDYMR